MNAPLADIRHLHGLMAEFDSAEELVAAARRSREAGYRELDAYAPFPVEELPDALDLPPSRVPMAMFVGGLIGLAGGYGMQYYATVIDYPMNIGGRPLPSWPALIPVTFELTILGAVAAGVIALFLAWRLPEVYHPVFNHPAFRRASQDRFFLCVEAGDPQFHLFRTTAFLETLGPVSVEAVEK